MHLWESLAAEEGGGGDDVAAEEEVVVLLWPLWASMMRQRARYSSSEGGLFESSKRGRFDLLPFAH